ncbi:MAG: hypothetical protein QXM52_03365 [Candidatus Bathyarchaeia archaeon]
MARSLVFSFLILSIFLPYVKITYYGEQETYEDFWWYTSLRYSSESNSGSQYLAEWVVPQWFAIPIFAFPFVLMYFGLKKRYTFDFGIIVFVLFFCWMTLPPLLSSMSMGEGWNLIRSEMLWGSYLALIGLLTYGVARIYLRGKAGYLERDRIPPPENLEQQEVAQRRVILILALLSFVLPFAVEYRIHHYLEYKTAELSTVYYWFGNINQPSPFVFIFLPIVYLPLIMMWLGMKRTMLFTNGLRLFTIYWVWHLLFFLKPFYVAEIGWSEQIIAPTFGIVFFPTTFLVYILPKLPMGKMKKHLVI